MAHLKQEKKKSTSVAIKNGRVKIQAEIADMKTKLDLAKRTTLKFREEIKKAQKEKGVEQTMFWREFNQYFDIKPLPRSVPVPQFQRKTNRPEEKLDNQIFSRKAVAPAQIFGFDLAIWQAWSKELWQRM